MKSVACSTPTPPTSSRCTIDGAGPSRLHPSDQKQHNARCRRHNADGPYDTRIFGIELRGRIRIIHTVSRRMGKMPKAVHKWPPPYVGGAIEPCFIPSCATACIIARCLSRGADGSVRSHTQAACNLLIHDANAMRRCLPRGGVCAILLRHSPPATVFCISEQRITATFWECAVRLTDKHPAKERTIRRLIGYLA